MICEGGNIPTMDSYQLENAPFNETTSTSSVDIEVCCILTKNVTFRTRYAGDIQAIENEYKECGETPEDMLKEYVNMLSANLLMAKDSKEESELKRRINNATRWLQEIQIL